MKNKDKVSRIQIQLMSFLSEAVRAFVADVAKKKMSFWHTKNLLYYFTTSFYNISFIRCSIFLPLHLNIII